MRRQRDQETPLLPRAGSSADMRAYSTADQAPLSSRHSPRRHRSYANLQQHRHQEQQQRYGATAAAGGAPEHMRRRTFATSMPISASSSSTSISLSLPGLVPGGVGGGMRARTWSKTASDMEAYALANYTTRKDWINLDQFHAISTEARQKLFSRLQDPRGPSAAALFWKMVLPTVLVCVIGLTVACLGIFVDGAEQAFLLARFKWLAGALERGQGRNGVDLWIGPRAFALFAGQSLVLVVLSFLVTQLSPSAAGGGVPEMKTVLSGSINPRLLSLRLVVVKITGLVLALGAGLSVGKEGPLVHAACAVSEVYMKMSFFRSFKSAPIQRLEMLSSAAAAGVAASFGSAFGATLFSVEITSTAYQVSGLFRAFTAAIVVVAVYWYSGKFTLVTLFSEALSRVNKWSGHDLLAWIALGGICGLVGALFVTVVHRISEKRNFLTRRRLDSRTKFLRRLAMVLTFTAMVIPMNYLELVHLDNHVGLTEHPHALQNYMVEPQVFGLSRKLFGYLGMKLLMVMLSVTLPLPVGLFSPVFLLGSIIGRCFGESLHYLETEGILNSHVSFEPWEFAIIGSASFSAGVTRAISTAGSTPAATGAWLLAGVVASPMLSALLRGRIVP